NIFVRQVANRCLTRQIDYIPKAPQSPCFILGFRGAFAQSSAKPVVGESAMTTTTQTIRLINHTGEPIPNTYEGRECQVRTDRQLNQRSSLHGSSLTLDHDSAVTAVLPPVEEGVYRVLPRELVL